MALLPNNRIRRPSRLLRATPDLGRHNGFDQGSLAHLAHIPRRAASDLLIRKSRQAVQDRPSRPVRWADIPELSTCVGRRPAAWQQCWQQSQRNSADPRPSAFRPDISQVGADRASVMRWRRSLLSAVGCCCCCQHALEQSPGSWKLSRVCLTVRGMARVWSGQAWAVRGEA